MRFDSGRLRRQNFNLAPTQYRQLRRLDFSSAKRPERRGVRRDVCTLWRDKLLKMKNIYMRCVAVKNRRLLIGRHLEIYLNADLCKYFSVLLYTFFILNCLLPRIFNHKCFYPMLLMSYWSKSHRASQRHVDATILKAFQQDLGTKITF